MEKIDSCSFMYKVIIVGDFGVGKTSLIRRFIDNSFSEEYKSSIGVSISRKNIIQKIEDISYSTTMMIWDIEGRTEFKPIFHHHLNGSKGFIIVADVTRTESIESIKEHIQICEKASPKSPIFIAFNKSDQEHKSFNIEEFKSYSLNIAGVFKTSAKDDICVREIFELLNLEVLKSSLS